MVDPDMNSPALAVVVESDGSLMRLSVSGELDLDGGKVLRDAIAAVGPGTAVELDLGDVEFLDSSGLRVLLEFTAEREAVIGRASDAVVRTCRLASVEFLLDGLRPGAQDDTSP